MRFPWFHRLPFLFPALVLVLVLLLVLGRSIAPVASSPGTALAPQARAEAGVGAMAATAVEAAGAVASFREWLAEYRGADGNRRAALGESGRPMLEQRRLRMARLIREDPEQALREGLRFDEYAVLPENLRALVERPFSEVAGFDFRPVCGGAAEAAEAAEGRAALELAEGKVAAFSFGRREWLMSKNSLPVQGIALDGAAAVHESALRELGAEEQAAALLLFPMARTDRTRSFLTGNGIAGQPVAAVGGGRVYFFADRAELETVNEAMAALEELPGPSAGSDVLYQAAPATARGGFDLAAAAAAEQAEASQWTETPKRVFMIRVDFSDRVGAAFGQAEVTANLNGPVSDQIRAMSYGKTAINGSVSSQVYRMPQTSAFYINGTVDSSLNDELLRDARNTFRTARSGGDAAVDLGPVSNNATGDGGGLGSFDIVGVLFVRMNMRSTIVYGGLAGGGDLWIQGENGPSLYVHEFGHNYGVDHSSFWKTNDGSVAGAGANREYGDDYDIMGGGPVPQGHFNAQAKARLNWLTSTEWRDATAGGSAAYRIYRIDSQSTAGTPRGVRLTRSAGVGGAQFFWLAYRPSFSAVPGLARGAYLAWQRPGATRSWLVDTTPETNGVITDAGITLGRTLADGLSNAFITPLAAGGSGAEAYLEVQVNFGPYPGNTPPAAGAIAGPATVAARSSAVYASSASDPNGDPLAYDWNAGDGMVNDNLSSLAKNWMTGGSYALNLTVSDMKGGTASVSKTITVTDPLDTWTAGSISGSPPLDQLLYAKGRFLCAEYLGGMFLSWDGLAWTAVGSAPDLDQPKLASGAGVFVAAGLRESNAAAGQIAWSVDGRLWKTAVFPAGIPPVNAVAYGAGGFVAVGGEGTVLRSADGAAWTVATVAGLPDFRHIVWSGRAWVATAVPAGGSWPKVMWTSPDGANWTSRSNLGVDIYQTEAHGGVCYALGWYAGVKYSTDHGLSWQDALLPAGTGWTTHQLARASDGTFLCTAQAMDERGSPYATLVSTDGYQWVRSAGNIAVAESSKALTFAQGRFYSVQDAGVIQRSGPFFPANAAPVATLTTAPSTAPVRQPVYLAAHATDADGDSLTYAWDFGPQAAVQDGFEIAPTVSFGGSYTVTLRVSDSRGGLTTLTHNITVADPARTFADRSVSATLGDFQAVASGGGRVVAVGSRLSGTFSGPRAWSTDGITWNTGNVGADQHLQALTYDGAQFIGAGTRYDFANPAGYRGWIATSPNGETWTQRYFAGRWLHAVVSGGGISLAAGEGGLVLRSTNGTSWSEVTMAGVTTGVTFQGLAWNGTVFLLTGYSGANGGVKVLTSRDGLAWRDVSAGAGVASWQDFRKCAWLNDRFAANGRYSKLGTSIDGGATFTSTRSDTEDTPALAYGAGIWFAAGINRSAGDADVDLLSLDGSTWFSFPAPTTVDRLGATFFNNTFITVGKAGSIRQSGTLTGSAGFPAWQTANFPDGGLASLPGRDPDADGLGNLLEYALNRLPQFPEPNPGDVVWQTGRPWFQIRLPEPARSDVRYRIQGSATPAGAWTDIALNSGTGSWTWQGGGTPRLTTTAPAGGSVLVQAGQPDPQLGQPRYFLRLHVEPW